MQLFSRHYLRNRCCLSSYKELKRCKGNGEFLFCFTAFQVPVNNQNGNKKAAERYSHRYVKAAVVKRGHGGKQGIGDNCSVVMRRNANAYGEHNINHRKR